MAVCLLYCILLGPWILVLDVLGEELLEKVVCYDMLACYSRSLLRITVF